MDIIEQTKRDVRLNNVREVSSKREDSTAMVCRQQHNAQNILLASEAQREDSKA